MTEVKRVINFMGSRKIAAVASVVLIVLSIGSLATKGLNLGLDFSGGRQKNPTQGLSLW